MDKHCFGCKKLMTIVDYQPGEIYFCDYCTRVIDERAATLEPDDDWRNGG